MEKQKLNKKEIWNTCECGHGRHYHNILGCQISGCPQKLKGQLRIGDFTKGGRNSSHS